MKTLYLDIFSGISGDMFLGAMIDIGVDAAVLEAELAKLSLGGYQLHVGRKTKANIEGVKFDVHLLPTKGDEHSHEHGHSHSHSHDANGGRRGRGQGPRHAAGRGALSRGRRGGLDR